ncbi:hypothetical protein, partial [Streptomyces broussonetiae]|uniref:hypothetical protein n=1 Tax=Streptomyces broussonetiae TaxID=2686304 RepID=UPI0035E28E99
MPRPRMGGGAREAAQRMLPGCGCGYRRRLPWRCAVVRDKTQQGGPWSLRGRTALVTAEDTRRV